MTRRLSREEADAALAAAVPIREDRGARRIARTILRGQDPSGAPLSIDVVAPILLVFAKTSCDGCEELAALVAEGIAGLEVLGCLREPAGGLPDTHVDALCSRGGRWLVGDDAFDALGVRVGPFFCALDAVGNVAFEGVAFGRLGLEELCARWLRGERVAPEVRLDGSVD